MNKRKIFIFLTILTILISACQVKKDEMERMPGIDLPVEEMNTDLHILAPLDINTFMMGDVIWLILYNTSNLPVVLPQDYGVHIFRFVEEDWEAVGDQLETAPGNKWVLANGDETHRSEAVIVDPAIYDIEPVQIRIVIVGNYVKANGRVGKEVGAYVDVTLNPK